MTVGVVKKVGKCCYRCWHWGHLLFNALLVLLAACLGLLACWMAFFGEISLPKTLVDKIKADFAQEQLEVSWHSAAIDPRGALFFRDFTLRQEGREHTIAQGSNLYLKLNLFRLLTGDFSLQQVSLDNGRINYPLNLSPSGTSDPLLESLNLDIRKSGQDWIVDHGIVQAGKARLRVTPGSRWSTYHKDKAEEHPSPPTQPQGKEEKPSLELADIYKQIIMIRKTLDLAQKPYLQIGFQPQGPSTHKLTLEATAEALRYESFFTSGPLYIHAEGVADEEGLTDWQLTALTDKVTTPFPVSLDNVKLSGHGPELDYPYHITLVANDIQYNGVTFKAPIFQATLQKNHQQMALFTSIKGGELSLHFDGNVEEPRGQLHLRANVGTDPLLQLAALQEEDFVERFSFPQPPILTATAYLVPDLMQSRLEYDLGPVPAVMKGAKLDSFHAVGTIEYPMLHVKQMTIINNGYRIDSEYLHHFETSAFRLLLTGNFLPEDFNPLLSGWWSRLWARFGFHGDTPYADLSVWGQWSSDERKVYGAVAGEDVSFQGLRADNITAKIKYQNEITDIFGLRASRPDAELRGDLQFNNLQKDVTRSSFNLFSTVRLHELGGVLGDEFMEVANMFSPATKPDLNFKGSILFGDKVEKVQRDISITATQTQPFTFLDYELDHLSLEALLTTDFLNVTDYSLGIADGLAKGSFLIERKAEGNLLTFDTHLTEADYVALRKILDLDKGDDEEDSSKGVVSLELQATGWLNDLMSFEGKGELKIEEAELARLRTLGALSSILEHTWLDQTTIVVEEITGTFDLKKELLDFSELELTASDSSFKAKGTYNMSNKALDFRVNAYLVDSKKGVLRTILTPVMKPIGEVLELILRGTLDEPRWRFAVDPRNLVFRNFGRVKDTKEASSPPSPNESNDPRDTPPKLAPGEQWYEWNEQE